MKNKWHGREISGYALTPELLRGGADAEEKGSLWRRQNPEGEMRNEHSTKEKCGGLKVGTEFCWAVRKVLTHVVL